MSAWQQPCPGLSLTLVSPAALPAAILPAHSSRVPAIPMPVPLSLRSPPASPAVSRVSCPTSPTPRSTRVPQRGCRQQDGRPGRCLRYCGHGAGDGEAWGPSGPSAVTGLQPRQNRGASSEAAGEELPGTRRPCGCGRDLVPGAGTALLEPRAAQNWDPAALAAGDGSRGTEPTCVPVPIAQSPPTCHSGAAGGAGHGSGLPGSRCSVGGAVVTW